MIFFRALLLISFLASCQQDPLSSEDHIAGWANSASALGVFTHGYEPLAYADGELTFEDPYCPATGDDGTTVIIGGNDCVDRDAKHWVGSARLTRLGTSRSIRFEDYGSGDDPKAIAKLTGDFRVTEEGPATYAFTASLRHRGGVDTEIEYQGTVFGAYGAPTMWNGQGTISRDSLAIHSGSVDAITVDQFRNNNICPGEGISGRTTMVSDEHQVDILYDGAEDCDGDYSARWRRDGVDKGIVPGVSCATVPGRHRPTPLSLLFLAFLACLGLRNRSGDKQTSRAD